ncbi:hypothetical protein SOVF_149330 isoform A [Spinacia oleracea]|nr:hypothetical protein SOVF_149330 isoform A [Spinacia oleracea]
MRTEPSLLYGVVEVGNSPLHSTPLISLWMVALDGNTVHYAEK